ncbi:MAG: tRNA (N6-isopentenyl adenosine(37)-C2)-methylthiotransferase MiaB [Lachnospiraceae bacterium]|nr:tRNA (N6-isopentenyl adenosine(37)-C2)-methylthiotransferase MiaB [Lachnospiraceae bacterium]
MDFYIDLKNIATEELKNVDLDRVNVNCSPPDFEPQRQYYFMAKCRQIVKSESERLGRPLTASVTTFGCQMNARDSEKLAGVLVQAGYRLTDSEEDADFVIYNTCTVRDNANQRVYGRLGYLNSMKKKKPHMKIALCGCMMQEESVIEKLKKSYRFIDLIFGTHNLFKFAELLVTMFENTSTGDEKDTKKAGKGTMIIDIWKETDRIVEELPVSRKYPYKSGINIMFGCNNFCSYCIVPYVRGRERSREPKEILREIEQLAADGVIEIMLLGQNVNSYGKNLEHPISFAQLLREVEQIDGIRRIRFMTSHPKDLSDELIQVMKESSKICHHLHLPLQSGSDRILQKMNRRYTKEHYLSLVRKIREAIPDIAITTDIIVGFPGETMDDVEETIDVVREAAYDNAFTFIYSKRTGTPAAAMEDQVPEEIVRPAFDKLLKVVQDTAKERALLLQGKVMEALVEERNEQDASLVTGRLSNNMLVHFPGDASDIGKLMMVSLDECHGFYYTGHAAQQEGLDK